MIPAMSVEKNKEVVLRTLKALQEGDYTTMLAQLTDDVKFYVIGSTRYSGLFEGKDRILNEILIPMGEQRDENGYSEKILTLMGEGVLVLTESVGQKRTRSGQQYNNEYAFIYRLVAGKITEWRCYLDTELLATTHK